MVLTPDAEDGGYTVTVPMLPGCVTEGDTVDEALAMAKDAISLWIESLEELNQSVPEESASPELASVEV